RMRVVYRIRPGITWHDGAPFTASDLVFSFHLDTDPGLPFVNRDALSQVESADATDDRTFVLSFKAPYYLADSLGLRLFWPYPEHLLGGAYEAYLSSGDPGDVVDRSYFTSTYVNLGPFRLTTFDPGEGLQLDAYDGYFLGRPKVD